GQEMCACGVLAKAANDPDVPIEYDLEFRQFRLWADGRYVVMYYCPSCGGRLADSVLRVRRPIDAEATRIADKIRNAQSLQEVITVLGEPDERGGPIVSDFCPVNVKGTLTYRSLSPDIVLEVRELENGQLLCGYFQPYSDSSGRWRRNW